MYKNIIFIVFASLFLNACGGVQSYPNKVIAGETAVLAAGWKHKFNRHNTTITITPSTGSPVILLPDDPAIRAIVNFYPDPISSLVLSQETKQDISQFSTQYGNMVNINFTNQDKDWWQTTVILDIPASIPVGSATIDIENDQGETASSVVEIIGINGEPDTFEAGFPSGPGGFPLDSGMIETLERIDHFVVSFDSPTVPQAIQLSLVPTDITGLIVHSRGDIAHVKWADINGEYRVLITPAKDGVIKTMKDFKFYVAITSGMAATASMSIQGIVEAYDENGNQISGITANVELIRGVAGLTEL